MPHHRKPLSLRDNEIDRLQSADIAVVPGKTACFNNYRCHFNHLLQYHSPRRLLTGSSLNTDIIGPTLPSSARKRLTPREMPATQGMNSAEAEKTVLVMNWAMALPNRYPASPPNMPSIAASPLKISITSHRVPPIAFMSPISLPLS